MKPLGQIAYEAQLIAHRDIYGFAIKRSLSWSELPDQAKAYWQHVGEAVAGAVRAEIVEIGAKIMQAVEPQG